MAYTEHVRAASSIKARCAILTLSDTRTEATDKSGAKIRELLTQASHEIFHYEILPDDPSVLNSTLQTLLARGDIDVILSNGGTGISRRDTTIPTIEKHIETSLPGFGELFRMLSYDQIQSGAMMSRAVAGIAKGKLIFAIPGSTAAVELAMTKLILPEIGHLIGELRK